MRHPRRRLPAEWEPQAGIMLTWPHPHSDWGPRLSEVEPVFLQLAELICRFEALLVVCHDPAHREHVDTLLREQGIAPACYRLVVQPGNDSWARDHGPIGVLEDDRPCLLDFRFNGWGNKYPAELDNAISRGLADQGVFAVPLRDESDFALEGGSIDSDGRGSLLTTRACLLNPNRNPGLSASQIETELHQRLGVERVLWLTEGFLRGDDTDSHIDMLARFCDPHTIAVTTCEDPADEHHGPLQRLWQELQALRDLDGQPYRLVALPIPAPIHDDQGQRLPASYANFLIVDGAVLVPQYADDSKDRLALQRLRDCFPERAVIGLDCRPLIQQYGSLHCITMQLPAGVLDERDRGSSSPL